MLLDFTVIPMHVYTSCAAKKKKKLRQLGYLFRQIHYV